MYIAILVSKNGVYKLADVQNVTKEQKNNTTDRLLFKAWKTDLIDNPCHSV